MTASLGWLFRSVSSQRGLLSPRRQAGRPPYGPALKVAAQLVGPTEGAALRFRKEPSQHSAYGLPSKSAYSLCKEHRC